jgi:hypothetical protein
MEEVNELKAALERSSAALYDAQQEERAILEELNQVRGALQDDEIRINEAHAQLQKSEKELIVAQAEVAQVERLDRELRLREEDNLRQHNRVISVTLKRTRLFQETKAREENFIKALVQDIAALREQDRLALERDPDLWLEPVDWREASYEAAAMREEAQRLQRRRAVAVSKEEEFVLTEISKAELATQEKRERRLELEAAAAMLPYPGRTYESVHVQTHSLGSECLHSPTCGQNSPPVRVRERESQSMVQAAHARHLSSTPGACV